MKVIIIVWSLVFALLVFGLFGPSAKASPASNTFSKAIALEVIDYGYARAASECHLRSNYWWETLNRAFLDYFYMQSFKFNLTDADREEAQKNVNELAAYATKQAQGPLYDCAALVNGPILKRLDQVQDEITGGYK